jgi:hypothetical protein
MTQSSHRLALLYTGEKERLDPLKRFGDDLPKLGVTRGPTPARTSQRDSPYALGPWCGRSGPAVRHVRQPRGYTAIQLNHQPAKFEAEFLRAAPVGCATRPRSRRFRRASSLSRQRLSPAASIFASLRATHPIRPVHASKTSSLGRMIYDSFLFPPNAQSCKSRKGADHQAPFELGIGLIDNPFAIPNCAARTARARRPGAYVA